MATKSITKNVVIRSQPLVRTLIRALENAHGKKSEKVIVDKKVRELHGEEIRELFK